MYLYKYTINKGKMQVVNYSELRKNMRLVMDSCCENHELTVVTRQNEPPVIMMSLDDYNSMEETVYLMKNPNNYSLLLDSIKELRSGKVSKHKLIEE